MKTDHAVIIVGAGPSGLMLAAELALANIDVAIIERRPDQTLAGQRAGGLHSRTLEVLEQRGLAQRFLDAGQAVQVAGFAWMPLDISDFPTRFNHGLALWQNHIERLLAERAAQLAVPILRDREVTGLTQDSDGVTLELEGGQTLRAQYVVGCDGGRSGVRKAAGIGFPGWEATISNLVAEVQVTGEPPMGLRHDALGVHAFGPLEGGGGYRVLVTEQDPDNSAEPTLDDLRAALVTVYGSDFGVHSPIWIGRFTDAARQADSYRKGRVLLAGDAAHIHYPAGGQGLNMGVQDAVNLGWKLAQVVKGASPDALLDTYDAERRPVVDKVLRNTLAQVALLGRLDDRKTALRQIMAELVAMEGPRKHLAAMISGLDIRYDFGEGHPLLGQRMPDLDVETVGGATTVYSLLHEARPVLLNLGAPAAFAAVADRVRVVDAAYAGVWDLPLIGHVPPPAAILIRPDGHVAWVGDGGDAGLEEALTRWFGR